MAVYRNIQTTFWTDAKVADEFTPEDKYFYLYLFTNPHTNLCGCYEISKKQVSWETGYSIDTVDRLIERFEKVHQVINFSPGTKELLILNWHKYNWTASDKFRKPLLSQIESIKCDKFRDYLIEIFNGNNTVSIPYQYGMDTTVTVTDTVSDTDVVNKKKAEKHYSPDGTLNAWIKEFIKHRKTLKKPMSDKAVELFVNRLQKLCPDNIGGQIEMIKTAIERGWLTVYADFDKKPMRDNKAKHAALEARALGGEQ